MTFRRMAWIFSPNFIHFGIDNASSAARSPSALWLAESLKASLSLVRVRPVTRIQCSWKRKYIYIKFRRGKFIPAFFFVDSAKTKKKKKKKIEKKKYRNHMAWRISCTKQAINKKFVKYFTSEWLKRYFHHEDTQITTRSARNNSEPRAPFTETLPCQNTRRKEHSSISKWMPPPPRPLDVLRANYFSYANEVLHTRGLPDHCFIYRHYLLSRRSVLREGKRPRPFQFYQCLQWLRSSP